MSQVEMFCAKRLKLATNRLVFKNSQQNCVKKAAYSLTVCNRVKRRVCFLSNFRTNSSKFYGRWLIVSLMIKVVPLKKVSFMALKTGYALFFRTQFMQLHKCVYSTILTGQKFHQQFAISRHMSCSTFR